MQVDEQAFKQEIRLSDLIARRISPSGSTVAGSRPTAIGTSGSVSTELGCQSRATVRLIAEHPEQVPSSGQERAKRASFVGSTGEFGGGGSFVKVAVFGLASMRTSVAGRLILRAHKLRVVRVTFGSFLDGFAGAGCERVPLRWFL
jgi:hypothetical protein